MGCCTSKQQKPNIRSMSPAKRSQKNNEFNKLPTSYSDSKLPSFQMKWIETDRQLSIKKFEKSEIRRLDQVQATSWLQIYSGQIIHNQQQVKLFQINKKLFLKNKIESIIDRLNKISQLQSHMLVQIIGWHESDNALYIITEDFQYETVLHYFWNQGKGLSLFEVQRAMHQITEIIGFLHNNNFTSNMITDVSFIKTNTKQNFQLKMISFGLEPTDFSSKEIIKDDILLYSSPELLQHYIVPVKSDIWSIGVYMISLLTGVNPFSKYANAQEAISNFQPSIKGKLWQRVKAQNQQLIIQTINKIHTERPEMAALLQADWFKRLHSNLSLTQDDPLNSLSNSQISYNPLSFKLFRKLTIESKLAPTQQVARTFAALDYNHSKRIPLVDLLENLKNQNLTVLYQRMLEAQPLLEDDKYVSYLEFITLVMGVNRFDSDQLLTKFLELFENIDSDYITLDMFKRVLKSLNMTNKEIEDLYNQLDVAGEGLILFADMKKGVIEKVSVSTNDFSIKWQDHVPVPENAARGPVEAQVAPTATPVAENPADAPALANAETMTSDFLQLALQTSKKYTKALSNTQTTPIPLTQPEAFLQKLQNLSRTQLILTRRGRLVEKNQIMLRIRYRLQGVLSLRKGRLVYLMGNFNKMDWKQALLSINVGIIPQWAYGTAGFRGPGVEMQGIVFRSALLALYRAEVLNKVTGIMITASHNPIQDNGVKIVDFNGEMLPRELEQKAVEFIRPNFAEILEQHFDKQPRGTVLIGCDTRPTSPQLLESARLAIQTAGGNPIMFSEVTTPILHWLVYKSNQSGSLQPIDAYVNQMKNNFKNFMDSIGPNQVYSNQLVIDCSGGVGALHIQQLIQDTLQIELRNTDQQQLNTECGSEHVQKERLPPSSFSDTPEKCASFDGDADRLVYFSLKGGIFSLLSGEYLIILYLQALLALQQRENVAFPINIITTAYSNSGLITYLNARNIVSYIQPVHIEPTGVKYLHNKAKEFPLSIYVEANGHGTIVTQQSLLEQLEEQGANLTLAYINLSNPVVGDAMADVLLAEASLKILDWDMEIWKQQIQEFEVCTIKVPAQNPFIVKTNYQETEVTEPPAIAQGLAKIKQDNPEAKLVVRASGTEPIIRVHAEAPTKQQADAVGRSAEEIIKSNLV